MYPYIIEIKISILMAGLCMTSKMTIISDKCNVVQV